MNSADSDSTGGHALVLPLMPDSGASRSDSNSGGTASGGTSGSGGSQNGGNGSSSGSANGNGNGHSNGAANGGPSPVHARPVSLESGLDRKSVV